MAYQNKRVKANQQQRAHMCVFACVFVCVRACVCVATDENVYADGL